MKRLVNVMKRPALAMIVVLSACGGSPVAPDIPVRLIGYGGLVTSDTGVTVIRDSSVWLAFVRQSGLRAPSGFPDDPLPAVNFPDEMALAVFLGVRPTSGYRVRIDRVVRDQSVMVIHATEEVPCLGATILTYPLTAVAVPRATGSVEVAWTVSKSC